MRKIPLLLLCLLTSACGTYTLPLAIPQLEANTPATQIIQSGLPTSSPEAGLNIFQPQANPPQPAVCPTCAAQATPTRTPIPGTPTLTATVKGDDLLLTPQPSSTAPFVESPTPSETSPADDPRRYSVQANSPLYLQNFAHPDAGCNWMGVAGQVFDQEGKPVYGLVVVIEGTINNVPVNLLGVTSQATDYGPGGYEILMGSSPFSSTQALNITLFDADGMALSNPVIFDTYAECQKNLALINFQQILP